MTLGTDSAEIYVVVLTDHHDLVFVTVFLFVRSVLFLYLFNSNSRYRRGQHTSHFLWPPQISAEILYRKKLYIEVLERLTMYLVGYSPISRDLHFPVCLFD